MGKSEVKITGTAIKMPVSKEDGTGEILMKVSMHQAVPKGLKSLGDSLYKVMVGVKAWKKIKNDITKDTFYIVTGEPKASVTSKGMPFVSVVAFQVETRPEEPKSMKAKAKASEEKPIAEVKVVKEEVTKVAEKKVESKVEEAEKTKKEPKKDYVAWFKNEKVQNSLIDVDVANVDLVEKIHLKPFVGRLVSVNTELSPIAIAPMENGRYKLITGIKAYIGASMYKKPLKAFVYDKSLDEFYEEFNVVSGNKKKQKKD